MYHYLEVGVRGPEVKAVQEALNLHPLGLKPLDPDGDFGSHTKAAVQAFQRRKHLDPDGVVGPLTLAALFPYGAYRLTVVVQQTGPVAAPQSQSVVAASAPERPVTVGPFPGLEHPLPMPLVPPVSVQTLPPSVLQQQVVPAPGPVGQAAPAASQTVSQTVQIKGGVQVSVPLNQSPAPKTPSPTTTTLVIDWTGLVFTPAKVDLGPLSGPGSLGLDLGMGVPISDGAKFTASASLAVTLAPSLLRWGRFDLLSLSAKAGVGVVGQKTSPTSYLSANNSLALQMSYDVISNGDSTLSLYLQGAFNSSLDHRDTNLHVTTTLPVTLGISGKF